MSTSHFDTSETEQLAKRARIEQDISVVEDSSANDTATVEEEPLNETTTEEAATATSEQTGMFRLRINNLPKFTTGNALKKFATNTLGLGDLRVNKAPKWNYAMVTVKSAEEQMLVLEKFTNAVMKKNTLQAEKIDDSERERFYERKREARRVEAETDTRTPDERLADQVTPLHAVDYDKQLSDKWRTSRNIMFSFIKELRKINAGAKEPLTWVENTGSESFAIEEITASPVQDGYRSKCDFTIGTNLDDEATVGFLIGGYKDGQVAVLNASNCKHVHPVAKEIANMMEACVRSSEFPVYNRVTKQGVWRNLLVKTQETGENMVVVQYNPTGLSTEQITQLKQLISATFLEQDKVEITTLMIQEWSDVFNGFTDKAPFEPLKGDGIIHENLLDCRFRLSATSFFQVNTKATEKLYGIVQDWCSLDNPQTILLDLCSGTGTIGITMASKVQQVIGIELCADAVEAARLNVQLNNCTNVTYHCGKVEDHINAVLKDLPADAPIVAVLDPPRAGVHPSVISAVRQCKGIHRIVFVACDAKQSSKNFIDLCRPTSNRYTGQPFQLVRVKPVDLFPHTKHCEMVLEFTRNTNESTE
ncbi:S-adenosyl-L-methionine-dependent methyltransferase [Syncephalis plumigaleata]|nr:S-adenosyl-L-methionine-dependent methyltransferase [Syncephalis plumigaleata]